MFRCHGLGLLGSRWLLRRLAGVVVVRAVPAVVVVVVAAAAVARRRRARQRSMRSAPPASGCGRVPLVLGSHPRCSTPASAWI